MYKTEIKAARGEEPAYAWGDPVACGVATEHTIELEENVEVFFAVRVRQQTANVDLYVRARLIEWRRSVLPAQLSSAAACWTARSVFAGDRLLGVRTLDVVLATCNAVVVHGVVGSLPVFASIVLYHLAYEAVVRLSPRGSTAARRVCAWTSCLCVLLACDLAEFGRGSSRPGSEERDGPDWRAFAARGWYGRGSFTHIKALRLTAALAWCSPSSRFRANTLKFRPGCSTVVSPSRL